MPAPASASAASALVRLRAQVVKEVLSILRDPRSRMVVLVPPLVQLLLFSFAATLEVRNVDIAVLDQDAGRILDRHLIAGERHQTRAQLAMKIVKRRALQGAGGCFGQKSLRRSRVERDRSRASG